jgi:hypothetical protein
MHRPFMIACVLALCSATPAVGASIDRSFGRNGVAQLATASGDFGYAEQVVPLSKGRMLVDLGYRSAAVLNARGRRIGGSDLGSLIAIAGYRGRAAGIAARQSSADSSPALQFQLISQTGQPVGPPQRLPQSTEDQPEQLLSRGARGWFVKLRGYHQQGIIERYTMLALTPGGKVDKTYGRDGLRTFDTRTGHRSFTTDGQGRLLTTRTTCHRQRLSVTVERILAHGNARDGAWHGRPMDLGRRCGAQIDGMTVDKAGRAILSVTDEGHQYLLRTSRNGGRDKRFGRAGLAHVLRTDRDSSNPYMTAPVAIRGGVAVGVSVGYDGAGVALLGERGNVRSIVLLPVSRRRPATAGLHLSRDARNRLLLAGAQFDDDDPFYLREDYGTPFPAIWRIRPPHVTAAAARAT